MRIILLNDSFPPQIDGVANTVLNYACILTDLGHSVMVMVPYYPEAMGDYPFEVVRYKSMDTTKLVGYRTGIPFEQSILDKAVQFEPDLIHVHCPLVSAILARTLRQITGVPIVFTYHTKFDVELKKYIDAKLLRDAFRKILIDNISAADEVWVVSNGAGENLKSLGYKGAVALMENGVDFPHGGVSQEEAGTLNAKYNIPSDLPLFLFVGRLAWYKGLRISFDSLAGLAKDGIDFRMLLVGDGSERNEMENYVASQGIADKVIFVGAVKDREELRRIFTRADLFLFPSTFDTNGIVVREAAACSLASVLIRNSCAAEGIQDGVDGILIEENAQSMESALRKACKDVDWLQMLGKNALERIYKPWSKSVFFASERYKQIIAKSKRGEYSNADGVIEEFFKIVSDLYIASVRVRDFFSEM